MNPPQPQSHALVRPSAFSNFPLLPADQLPFNSPRTTFHHPGYPDMDNVLFSLSPIDNGGVHYGTALSACIIVACNVKGYLATSRGDPDRNRDFDEILTARKYYYYAASSVPKYPVCPSFDDWVFPADPANIMPPSWLEAVLSPETMSDNSAIPMGCSQMSYAVTVRDQSCRMSGTRDICQNAHLVPLANARWFQRNSLRGFNLNPALSRHDSINDIRNGVLLRQDLHTALDAHKFTFAVKGSKLVTHFLAPTSDLGRQFHNCQLRPITDARPEFFFARFALSVFPLIDDFATSPGKMISKSGGLPEEVGLPPRPSTKRKRTMDLRPRSQDGEGDPPTSTGRTLTAAGATRVEALADLDLDSESTPGASSAHRKKVRHLEHWHDRVLSEPYDSSEEDREDLALAERHFPAVFDGTKTPPRHVYETINFYPGQRSVQRVKARWMSEHPNVYLTKDTGGQ